MNIWRDKKSLHKKEIEVNNNRIRIIMAIVFLLGGALAYRLFILQVKNSDLYSNLATGQHQISSELTPVRGSIYLAGYDKDSSHPELYVFATNKDFADVYAVPKDIINPSDIADKFYQVFKKDKVEKEVEELLDQDFADKKNNELNITKKLPAEEQAAKIEEINQKYAAMKNDPTYLEYREIKKEQEIKTRQEEETKKYFDRLAKKDDVYEPLEKKVDEDTLKKLFALLLANDSRNVQANNLSIKQGKIYLNLTDNLNSTASDEELTVKGIGLTMTTYRYYPEGDIGSQVLGFARDVDGEMKGSYGLEGFFNTELAGTPGYIQSERSADKNAIILNDREYMKPIPGSDLVLTIDRSVEFTVCEKLEQAVTDNAADSGSVIVMNPRTGAIIAMCSYPDFDPNNYQDVEDISIYNNPAVFGAYEPGSIFKAITMAAGLDQEKVTPSSTYNDTGVFKIAGYEIKNSDKLAHGICDMTTVLEESLNTGVIYVMEQIGVDKFLDYIKNFGFGEKTGVELEGESKGDIRNLTESQGSEAKELYSATASFGQGITVTPLQMVAAFSAIANGGTLVKPYIVQEIIKPDGTKTETTPVQIGRVISAKTSALLGGMLVEVVEKGHGKRAGVKGYYVAGKTGTAQVAVNGEYQANLNIGSFAGFAPANDPAFAMIVRINHPRNVQWAESSAAPLFGQIAEYLLNYYQVPKER